MSNSKRFEIEVADDTSAEDILGRARSAAQGAGITITGDEASGRFRGTAEGSYTVDVESRVVRVEVTNKPSFVPWTMVEGALKRVFG